MEFVSLGWSTRKWLGLYQIIRNLTSGDLGIPLSVIRPVTPGLKNTRLIHLPDLFEGRGEKGQSDLVCVNHLWMIGLMVVVLMSYSRVVSVVLVFWRVGSVLTKVYGI